MDGLLVEVTETQLGSQAVTPAGIGDTEVVVEDLTDFPEDGGVIDILGVRYAYDSVIPEPAVMDEAGDVRGGGSLILSEPLSVDVDLDDPVWLVVGDQVATEAVAIVDIDAGDDTETPDGGDMVHIPLDINMRLVFPVGIYDPPCPVTVTDDLSAILGAPGVRPVVSGDLIDPSTLPKPVPVDPPEASPVITVEGLPNSLLVKTFDTVAPSTRLQYHVSTTPEFTPDASTLVAESRATVFILKTLADGTELAPETPYHVRVVAVNGAGQAEPSPAVSGVLDPKAIIEMALERLVAGFVLTGAIQVGQILIDANEGITIPSEDGVIRFPVDGSVSTITANLIATALVMQGVARLQDVMQVLGGGIIRLTDAGVADPSDKPVISSTWKDQTITAPAGGYVGGGLTLDETGNYYVLHDGDRLDKFSVTDGSYAGTFGGGLSGTSWGQLVRVGSYYFAVGTRIQGRNLPSNPVLYKYNLAGARVAEYVQTSVEFAYGSRASVSVGPDDTNANNVLLAYRLSGSNVVTVRTHNLTGGLVSSANYTLPGGTSGLMWVGRGSYIYGATRTVIAPETGSVSVFNGTAEASANRFSAGATATGMAWLGDRFASLIPSVDATTAKVRRHSRIAAAVTLGASYTWYDGNPAGDGPVDAAFHETLPSPFASASIAAGKFATVECAPAPAAGSATPGPDDPTLVRVYAGTPTRTLQATLPLGTRTVTIDAPITGDPEPTVNTFLGIPDLAPGVLRTEAEDASGPKIELLGNGSGRLGKLRIEADGDIVIPSGDTGWYQPIMNLRATAAQTVGNNTWTQLALASLANQSRAAAGTFTAISSGIRIDRDGWYEATAYVAWAINTAGRRLVRIVQAPTPTTPADGNALIALDERGPSPIGAGAANITSPPLYLTAGTHLRIEVYQGSGGNLQTTTAHLSVKRV